MMGMNQNQAPQTTPARSSTGNGGTIAHVQPGSIADDLHLQPGDVVLAANGTPLRDVIDYRFAIADETLELLVQTGAGAVLFDIEKDPDEDLGIAFTDMVFDRVRRCANQCPFCFVTQMPGGVRDTLTVKDDDYRLSFLCGNFITLTNLHETDWQRIGEQHLSPLYISVHATDPVLRGALLGRRGDTHPDVREQLRRLGDMGIVVHTQIVAVPGVNDGTVLHQTIDDLTAHFPTVQSIAVVPVGITRYRQLEPEPELDSRFDIRPYTPDEARQVVACALTSGDHLRQRTGRQLVYPGDEFFLLAGHEIPPDSFYDDYPQYFNGVGMIRDFLTAWEEEQPRLPHRLPHPLRVSLVCGTLVAPLFQQVAEDLNQIDGLNITVVPVVNRFFGDTVTVSGLLTGQDVVDALRPVASASDHALLPRVMFDHDGSRTLDNLSLPMVAAQAGVPVSLAGHPYELVQFLRHTVHQQLA